MRILFWIFLGWIIVGLGAYWFHASQSKAYKDEITYWKEQDKKAAKSIDSLTVEIKNVSDSLKHTVTKIDSVITVLEVKYQQVGVLEKQIKDLKVIKFKTNEERDSMLRVLYPNLYR